MRGVRGSGGGGGGTSTRSGDGQARRTGEASTRSECIARSSWLPRAVGSFMCLIRSEVSRPIVRDQCSRKWRRTFLCSELGRERLAANRSISPTRSRNMAFFRSKTAIIAVMFPRRTAKTNAPNSTRKQEKIFSIHKMMPQ